MSKAIQKNYTPSGSRVLDVARGAASDRPKVMLPTAPAEALGSSFNEIESVTIAPFATGIESADVANLQAFFNSLQSIGGKGIIPPGTYAVNNNIVWNVASTKTKVDAYGAIFKVGSTFPLGANPVLSIRGSNYLLFGLSIDGSDIANRALTIRDNAQNVRLVDLEISHCAQQAGETDLNNCGLRFEGNIKNVWVVRPYIHHIKAGTSTLASLARGIEFGDPNGVGPAKNVQIIDPTFEDITYTGISTDADAIHIGYTPGTGNATVIIRGGYYTRIFKRAIKIQSPGVTVLGGLFENTYLGTSGVNVPGATDPQVYAAVSIYEADCEVIGFKGLGGSWLNGIEVGTVGTALGIRAKVNGCRIVGGATASMANAAGCRVYGSAASGEIEIVGNTFDRFLRGVWLSTAGYGIGIHSNKINGYGVANTSGIYIDGDNSNLPVRINVGPNSYEGLTRYAVEPVGNPTDINIIGQVASRTGFEIIASSLYTTPSRRPNAVGNIGSGATANADGLYGENHWQGGVFSRLVKAIAVIVYSAAMTPDATKGDWQTISVSDNVAFTINAPTNPPGAGQSQELTLEFLNNTAGVVTNIGTAVFNAAFVILGGALTNPAAGKKVSIRFSWNGTKWIETYRSTATY